MKREAFENEIAGLGSDEGIGARRREFILVIDW
jgi:hypothetical protein